MPTAARKTKARGIAKPRHTDVGSRNRPGGQWLHSARWRKARALFLSWHPLCIDCLAADRYVAATDVDHEVPHEGDYELFWNQDNWRARCHSHHSKKTAASDGGFGNRKSYGRQA